MERSAKSPNNPNYVSLEVTGKDGKWSFDHIEDFFAAYGSARGAKIS
jgi:hypothetical protein